MRASPFPSSHRRRLLGAGIFLAACAAAPLQPVHADPADRLFPGVAPKAPAGKEPSIIAADKAHCAIIAQGNLDKYATCLEDLQYVLSGSAKKAAAASGRQQPPAASTALPPGLPANPYQAGAADNHAGLSNPPPENRNNYTQIAKLTAAGDAEFKAEHYVAALRDYIVIDGMDSAIAANASQFGLGADKLPADAPLERRQAYDALQDLVAAQRNIGLVYERGLGEEQSYMMAAGWYDRALSHGLSDAEAEEHLGVLLGNGLGVAQNVERAAQLLADSHNDDLVVLLKHDKLPRTFDAGANPETATLAARLRAEDTAGGK